MPLNDILDTILVTRKPEPHPASQSASSSSGANNDTPQNRPSTTPPTMSDNASPSSSGDVCPVDHKTRELWLQQARASGAAAATTTSPHPPAQAPTAPPQAAQPPSSSSWSPWSWFSSPAAPQPTSQPPPLQQNRSSSPQYNADGTLDTTRTISSIPRSSVPGGPAVHSSPLTPPSVVSASPPRPLNNESETGASPSGNWIYPSELQFFEAMRRKGFTDTQVSDMKTVVPIHNAVNEKAWEQIKEWEAPYAGECGLGPRLYSFAGVKERMTPRARVKTLLGYTAPFDRHDWIVDRCGKRVEYVIDFYAGRQDGGGEGKVNFYLDVRPKVNSWEGVKMRVLRGVGLA
ncbi:cytochrome c/c1 heme-lyase [Coniochaeta sp. 2T2.1]|nr:cytochrome c/c1 heme-lyase [Coniochaeta sp. 2T2.1]